ncbi:MAG TPA: urate oxidase [Thermoanaerobaculia bacterium]|nr:urate oxidase [Thermoanaerobaculia bacterium]
MNVVLADNGYGKERVRLVKVERAGGRHTLRDLTLSLRLSGEFTVAHVAGDNAAILPTDTMRNTVYALAAEGPLGAPEEFAARLAEHLLASGPEVTAARIAVEERPWRRLAVGGAPHPHAFEAAAERHTAEAWRGRDGGWTEGGLADLLLLKTAGSGFAGFRRDRWTTLRETANRILATRLAARWRYAAAADGERPDYAGCHRVARQLLVDTFAAHKSRSLQHTLYAMAEAVLEGLPALAEIHLALPNLHHVPFDLGPLGLENRDEVFVALPEPHGLIEATVRRAG